MNPDGLRLFYGILTREGLRTRRAVTSSSTGAGENAGVRTRAASQACDGGKRGAPPLPLPGALVTRYLQLSAGVDEPASWTSSMSARASERITRLARFNH
jgi:hypothetical protein